MVFPTVFGGPIHVPADNFTAVQPEILDQVGRLAHAMLACLIAGAGGPAEPLESCGLDGR